tara:strand:- start:15 stop:524 length:510 start_codon:yes stop_codon:yes gene_type:complete
MKTQTRSQIIAGLRKQSPKFWCRLSEEHYADYDGKCDARHKGYIITTQEEENSSIPSQTFNGFEKDGKIIAGSHGQGASYKLHDGEVIESGLPIGDYFNEGSDWEHEIIEEFEKDPEERKKRHREAAANPTFETGILITFQKWLNERGWSAEWAEDSGTIAIRKGIFGT